MYITSRANGSTEGLRFQNQHYATGGGTTTETMSIMYNGNSTSPNYYVNIGAEISSAPSYTIYNDLYVGMGTLFRNTTTTAGAIYGYWRHGTTERAASSSLTPAALTISCESWIYMLAQSSSTSAVNTSGTIKLRGSVGIGYAGAGDECDLHVSGDCTVVGTLTNFTGSHTSLVEETVDYSQKIGYIVCSSGKHASYDKQLYGKDAITMNDAVPITRLSSSAKDKKVFGVISANEETNKLTINSLGEGAMWICNINGALENGDYICSSAIEGLGMKQDSEFLANYTVAKITMDCDFSPQLITKKISPTADVVLPPETERTDPVYFTDSSEQEYEYETKTVMHAGQEYIMAFVAVTYHCG